MGWRHSQEQTEHAISLLKLGIPQKQVARQTGIPSSTIKQMHDRAGLKTAWSPEKARSYNNETREYVIALVKSGVPIGKAGKLAGMSRQNAQKICKEENVESKTSQMRKAKREENLQLRQVILATPGPAKVVARLHGNMSYRTIYAWRSEQRKLEAKAGGT